MAFKRGDSVQVPNMRQVFEVMEEADSRGICVVCHGALQLKVAENLLSAAQKKKEKKNHPHPSRDSSGGELRLDLHGKTEKEAIALLDDAFNTALLRGINQLEIIHGIGSGKITKVVHDYLRKSKHVAHFKIGEGNPGVTFAYL